MQTIYLCFPCDWKLGLRVHLRASLSRENVSWIRATSWEGLCHSQRSWGPAGRADFFLSVIMDISKYTLPGVAKNLSEAVLLLPRTNNWHCWRHSREGIWNPELKMNFLKNILWWFWVGEIQFSQRGITQIFTTGMRDLILPLAPSNQYGILVALLNYLFTKQIQQYNK